MPPVPVREGPRPQGMARQEYVDAFGFVCHETALMHTTRSLEGTYISCTSHVGLFPGWPCPCIMCRHFKAIDEHTLENDISCCLGVLPCDEKATKGPGMRYTRTQPFDGQPNVFRNGYGAVEFGSHNGLCAASENAPCCSSCVHHVCYCRVC